MLGTEVHRAQPLRAGQAASGARPIARVEGGQSQQSLTTVGQAFSQQHHPTGSPDAGAYVTPVRALVCEEVTVRMLTAEEIASWRETIRAWVPVGEVSELAEIMAALDPEERAQVLRLMPDADRLGNEIERLLSGSRR